MRQIQQSLQTFARSLTLIWLAAPRATAFLLVSQVGIFQYGAAGAVK